MYLTFNEFTQYNIQPFQLTEPQFESYECKARMKVDRYTQNRISNLETIPENIKILMVELICILYSSQEAFNQAGNVKSVSNDGYSVTYSDVNTDSVTSTEETKIYSLITDYAKDYCWRGLD